MRRINQTLPLIEKHVNFNKLRIGHTMIPTVRILELPGMALVSI